MAANIETKTSRIKALLLTMDGIMKTKSDPYELLRTGVLHSESVRREDKAVLVSDLLKEVLPKYRHCIVGSLRVPFSRALFRAKMDELRVAKERPIVKMHMREPRIVYFDTDADLVRRVLRDNKDLKERAIEATRKKANAALADLEMADRMEVVAEV
jgi:hypothetical protein